MKMMSLFRFFVLTFSAGLLVACSSHDTRLTSSATRYLGADGSIVTRNSVPSNYAEKISYWDGDGVSGSPSIVINLSKQTASFYKGGQLVGVSAISSGREGYRTPTGSFKITQKNKDHASNLYGDYVDPVTGKVVVANVSVKEDPMPAGTVYKGAPMPYFMRFTGGVGMHAGFLPGVPDSHGCIRMPENMAETFFANVAYGTPVRVTY